MMDFDGVMLVFGMIISVVGIIVAVISIIKIYKRTMNEYKNRKFVLIGMGIFILIFYIINYIKNALIYG